MSGPAREKSPEELAILERLRALCRDLPEVAEAVDGFGHTSFRVRDRPFAMMGSSQIHLAIKADHATQDMLVKTGAWTRTPYIGQHGWVSIADLDHIDWDEIAELVEDGWRIAAPKSLVRKLDAGE